jgi:hypothetical protein
VRRLFVVAALLASACGSTGQDVATFPIHGAGAGEATFESNGWSVTIERADVAFGPVYFCATSFADMDVCPAAEAEWLGTASIDALDPASQMLGEASAITATVRSAMFDYGRSWLLTAERPRANEGAPRGRSAVFVVRAMKDGVTLEVRASLDIDPANAGQSAVIGAPTGEEAIEGNEALTVRVDAAAWWRRVDLDAVAAMDADGDGVVELARGDVPYEALVLAMTAGTLPRFEWTQP